MKMMTSVALRAASASVLHRDDPGVKPIFFEETDFVFEFIDIRLVQELLNFDFVLGDQDAKDNGGAEQRIKIYVKNCQEKAAEIYKDRPDLLVGASMWIGMWNGLATNKVDTQARVSLALAGLTKAAREKAVKIFKEQNLSARLHLSLAGERVENFIMSHTRNKQWSPVHRLPEDDEDKDDDADVDDNNGKAEKKKKTTPNTDFYGHPDSVFGSILECGTYPCKMICSSRPEFCIGGLCQYFIHLRDLEGFVRLFLDWIPWGRSGPPYSFVGHMLTNGGALDLETGGIEYYSSYINSKYSFLVVLKVAKTIHFV